MESSVDHSHWRALTRDDLFCVLGKICYAMELLQAKFDDEDVPIGVEEALAQLEESREPLFKLLLAPEDLRSPFVLYMQKEYEIVLNLDFAVEEDVTEDKHVEPLVGAKRNPLRLVPSKTSDEPPT